MGKETQQVSKPKDKNNKIMYNLQISWMAHEFCLYGYKNK
jgi:hypothetical protein